MWYNIPEDTVLKTANKNLADNRDLIETHNTIILEVGGGATDIMLMAKL